MQLDSDVLETVRDEVGDFLRMLLQEIEMDEGIKRTFTLDLNKSCGDAETNIKVRVQKPRSNLKTDLDAAGEALMRMAKSRSRSRRGSPPLDPSGNLNSSILSDPNKPCWDKHHANCIHDN
jgi:hypothetical protein